jgi:DNA-binding beta-propeller fold protein YncE
MPFGLSLSALFLGLVLPAVAAPFTAGQPILLENTKGNFDFIRIDTNKHRLLLAHTGNKTLDVFDLDTKKLLKSVPTGAAQDAATDVKRGRYYAAVSAPPRMAIVDAETLEMRGEVPLSAAADLMTFNPANGLAYVCNDTAPELWVIDPEAKKILTTITFKGKGMEDLAFDPSCKRLFQVLKTGNGLFVVDPASNKIVESWTTDPATGPHGIAIVPEADLLLAAGANGKLALVNRSSGKLVASADIARSVDEMAYDSELHLAYCASSNGRISVVALEGEKLNAVETLNGGGKSIVVDPKTHTVWNAYSKGGQSFVQPFTPGK